MFVVQKPVPIALLDAEIAAFPFCSEPSLAIGVVTLDAGLGDDTARLWRAAENHLLLRFSGYSVDELTRLRDRSWFASRREKQPLLDVLRSIASAYLRPKGTVAVPSRDGQGSGSPGEHSTLAARQAWRWLARLLPTDLLLASLQSQVNRPSRVDSGVPFLSRRLKDDGFAEVHVHLGAAIDFDIQWAATVCALTHKQISEHDLISPGGMLEDGAKLGLWLIRAMIVRQLLGWYLMSRADGKVQSFEEFLTQILERVRRSIGYIAVQTIWGAIRDVERGSLTTTLRFVALREACRALIRHLFGTTRNLSGSIAGADPLSPWFPASPHANVSTEMEFITAAFALLDRQRSVIPSCVLPRTSKATDDQPPDCFNRLFWQSQRVRCIYFLHVTQRPMTPGLSWFARSFDRGRAGRRSITPGDMMSHALLRGGFGEGLKHFEFRTGPSENAAVLGRFTKELFARIREDVDNDTKPPADRLRTTRAGEPEEDPRSRPVIERRQVSYTNNDSFECGMVLHFLRVRGGNHEKGIPKAHGRGTHGDPRASANAGLFRYSAAYQSARKQAIAVATLLALKPTALVQIRAIDLCNDESAVPLWVYVPMFNHLRRQSEQASLQLLHRLNWRVKPLQTTVHAGEDFGHLLSGLRVVAETVEFLRLGPGDRLGHAIALGIDPAFWAKSAARVTITKEQRLFDLAWERGLYGSGKLGVDSGRLAFLDTEISRLAHEVFGTTRSPLDVQALTRDLHVPELLQNVGFPDQPRRSPKTNDPDGVTRWSRLREYLTSYEIYDRGQELMTVDPSPEIDVCRSIQHWLCNQIAGIGIAVEINPSSNLLVGNLGSLRNHPFWQLSGPTSESPGAGLRLVVGSDDPLVFATTLPEEYVFLHDSLIEAGVSPVEADRWLEGLRQSGIDFRFTDARALENPPPLFPSLGLLDMAKELA